MLNPHSKTVASSKIMKNLILVQQVNILIGNSQTRSILGANRVWKYRGIGRPIKLLRYQLSLINMYSNSYINSVYS